MNGLKNHAKTAIHRFQLLEKQVLRREVCSMLRVKVVGINPWSMLVLTLMLLVAKLANT